jgi:hypothetical protein
MDFLRYARLTSLATLLLLGACARQQADEMAWARSALQRNGQVEIVASDPQTRTFTVRVKDTGELRMVHADELMAAPTGTHTAAPAAAPAPAPAAAAANASTSADNQPPAPPASATASPGEAASADNDNAASEPASASLTPQNGGAHEGGGRVIEQGPGYSIRAAAPPSAVSLGRVRDSSVTTAAVERRHEPIICQGSRLLHIDNRNLEFDGDAVNAEDGCEIHITNSHISATGVGITARAANVHIDNSLIEGSAASIDASDGAQVYAASSRFKGLSRRLDTASFHDLGGNIWN